jgi:hypothetical protein
MPNTIKYSTTGDTFSLKKGNLFIGVGDVGKGPSTSTQTYNGVSPVASGYTIYIYNPAQASNVSFYSANNDAELITFTNGIAGQTFTGVAQCLNWYATQTNYVCVNRDYEGIVTNGLSFNIDAGFTPSYPRTGSTLYDISYSGNNGTLINGPIYSGSNGGVLVFDGADDYVDFGSSSSSLIQNKTAFTISTMFKLDELAVLRPIFGTLAYGCGGNLGIVSSNGGLTFYNDYGPWPAAGGTCYSVGFSPYVVVGQWIYAVATYDGTTTRMYGIKNGTLSTTSGGSKTGVTNTFARNLRLFQGGAYVSKGSVISANIYNRVLSQSEILQNYQSYIPRLVNGNIITNGLTYYVDAGYNGSYPTTGTTWYDISGNGYNGTLTNGPTFNSANGGGITFDGTDDFISGPTLPTNSLLSFSNGNFTLEHWIKITGYEPGTYFGLTNMIMAKGPASTYNYATQVTNSTTLTFIHRNNSESLIFLNFTVPTLTNNITQIVFSITLTQVSLYLNGVLSETKNLTGNPITPYTNDILLIGGHYATNNTNFIGDMYLHRIYNRPLNGNEILQNFNAQKSRFGL